MERCRIIALFLVIHFVGEIIPYDDENYEGSSQPYNKELPAYKEDLLQIIEAENKLYERLISNYYNNNSAFEVNDDTIFDIVYFYYALFWKSVNLRIRSLVYQSNFTVGKERRRHNTIYEMYESVFKSTSNIFENLKEVIRNYYHNTQNEDIICGSTFSDNDTGTAESVWKELLKLNLNFVKSTDTLAQTAYSSDIEYTDGLVKWNEIDQTNDFKTLFPTNSPDEINILKLNSFDENLIKYFDDRNDDQADVIQSRWCTKLINFINTEIHRNILNCFFTKLTGLLLVPRKHNHVERLFMLTYCPTEKNIEVYRQLMQRDKVRIPTAIQMIRFATERTNIIHSYALDQVDNEKKKLAKKESAFLKRRVPK